MRGGFDIPREQFEAAEDAENDRLARLAYEQRIALEANRLGFERIGSGPAGVIG